MHVTDNRNATYAEGITAGASDIEVDNICMTLLMQNLEGLLIQG